jgi:amidohydrolase
MRTPSGPECLAMSTRCRRPRPALRNAALGLAALAAMPLHAAEPAAADALRADIDRLARDLAPRVIETRRYLHERPELSNREVETGKYLAKRLRDLGLEVQHPVAKTGVVAVLRGGKPGPVVALRSDIDALPVAEEVDVPFRSKVRTTFDGKDVGVMHACGHDAHMAILLGVAEALVKVKDRVPGTVKFLFQPAEEGSPPGEEGGAQLMIKEGVLKNDPAPGAIFGLHVVSALETNVIGWRAGGMMASADDVIITVKGRQTHGAQPWNGVDPIVVASQIVSGLQSVVSRQMDLTTGPVVLTIGKIEGGTRFNIVPEEVVMKGTLRALDPEMRRSLHERVKRTAEQIAAASGATAAVSIGSVVKLPVTYNDAQLQAQMLPTLERVAASAPGGKVVQIPPVTISEDFAEYQRVIPGVFVHLGIRKPGASIDDYAPNHSPRFKVDEAGLELGVRTLANLALDWLASGGAATR